MLAYRLVRAAYADLAGEGARLYGGRWNNPGRNLVYLARSASLALLELRVHLGIPFNDLPVDFLLLTIDLDAMSIETLAALPGDQAACASFGDSWLAQQRSAVLQVPSVIVPESTNLLLNPAHPDSVRVQEVARRPFDFDE